MLRAIGSVRRYSNWFVCCLIHRNPNIFRDILQNFLASILILLTEPFQIDDQIVFKDFEVTVENIQTRATTIKTYDGRRIVIPNSELFTNSVSVNTTNEKRQNRQNLGLAPL